MILPSLILNLCKVAVISLKMFNIINYLLNNAITYFNIKSIYKVSY